jgi:hypothetical protein
MTDTSASRDYLRVWVDHPDNPLIEPPRPEFLLGDPSVVLPADSPEGDWHLFANTLLGIQHYISRDGIVWARQRKVGPGFRANVLKEGGLFHMFYEQFSVPQFRSHVALRTSPDLWRWREPVKVLEPSLPWEQGRLSRNVGNPCVVATGDGYRLYYSAGVVFHRDLGFCEPRHVGVAQAVDLSGPYEKKAEPMIPMDPSDPFRSRGAGAIKVMRDESRGLYYGFNNGIYRDARGRTRSAILLLSSADGLAWEQVYPEPVVAPEDDGWKRALVYQLDVKRVGDEMWMYYNARSGWRFGRERIGLATCTLT